MSNIGYIRVSSYSQNIDRQLAGVELEKRFEEKASAKDAKRPELQSCIEWAREGDVVHVHSIDRLARNLADLLSIIQELNTKGVTVHFHKENMTFTGEDDPIQNLMLSVMGAVAEFERTLINERRREGMAAAKAAGKQIGAKKKLSPDMMAIIRSRLETGESKKALAEELGISRTTLYASLSACG